MVRVFFQPKAQAFPGQCVSKITCGKALRTIPDPAAFRGRLKGGTACHQVLHPAVRRCGNLLSNIKELNHLEQEVKQEFG